MSSRNAAMRLSISEFIFAFASGVKLRRTYSWPRSWPMLASAGRPQRGVQLRLQPQNLLGIGTGLLRVLSGKSQHFGDMIDVLLANDLESRIVAEVVVAVGQADRAGTERGDDHLAVLLIVLAADSEERGEALGVQAMELRAGRCP